MTHPHTPVGAALAPPTTCHTPEGAVLAPPTNRRGGKRPGAGAPKGNLNALKTGSRSQQLNIVIEALLASPTIRRVMLKL
ncbi:MAG: hypothetical protein MUP14_02085, partial [Dehalococcoidia bacterium]|nr:hypothetical protein [Dehalococcoidia bacterium]